MQSFADVEKWLTDLPNQQDGLAGPLCEAGEPYQEFYATGLARPGDENAVEEHVASHMHRQLATYFEDRKGRIYWRKRFETDDSPRGVIIRFDENGSDTDFETGRKCVKDNNWRRLACYCRLYRARHAVKAA